MIHRNSLLVFQIIITSPSCVRILFDLDNDVFVEIPSSSWLIQYFLLNDHYYKRIKGSAMGCPLLDQLLIRTSCFPWVVLPYYKPRVLVRKKRSLRRLFTCVARHATSCLTLSLRLCLYRRFIVFSSQTNFFLRESIFVCICVNVHLVCWCCIDDIIRRYTKIVILSFIYQSLITSSESVIRSDVEILAFCVLTCACYRTYERTDIFMFSVSLKPQCFASFITCHLIHNYFKL